MSELRRLRYFLAVARERNFTRAAEGLHLGTAMRYYDPESVSIEVTSVIAEGDAVAAEWTSRARTASGDPYENHCAAVFGVRDGRIQSVREYMDTLYASEVAFGRAASRT